VGSSSLEATPAQLQALSTVRLAIFDIDDTLAFPRDPAAFYAHYSDAVVQAIAEQYDVNAARAREVADVYRMHHSGGEQALFRGDAHRYFDDLSAQPGGHALLYDHMVRIDPVGHFDQQPEIRSGLQWVRAAGIAVVALTSSPDMLSRRILAESGYDPDTDFDRYYTYTREGGPDKKLNPHAAFTRIAEECGVEPEQVIAIGDNMRQDVQPALDAGMQGCLLNQEPVAGFEGMRATRTMDIITALVVAHVVER